MSRCAHDKSIYKLTPLPRCRRCNIELNLVAAVYDNSIITAREEWECSKCGKIVPKNKIRGPNWTEEDIVLHNWCQNES